MFHRGSHILNMRKIHNNEENIYVTFTYVDGRPAYGVIKAYSASLKMELGLSLAISQINIL